jgi:tetratricopeptide (TPR) repeat protein/TolB-like protein
MMRRILPILLALALSVTVYAQTKPRLAVLPFTGGTGKDGETIATLLSYRMNNEFTVIPRTGSVEAIMKEQQFQRSSGLTDSDTIARLGRQYNADLVVAGHIQKLEDRNLVLITIINVESLQQIAGDYREYRTIEEMETLLPDMARRIINASKADTSGLPRLAVLPFAIPQGVNAQDAEVLAQLLATEIANSGKYAVLPRTESIQRVMEEQNIQRSGLTDPDTIKAVGRAVNARYVLSGNVRDLGTTNMFTAEILNIEDGSQIKGNYRNYKAIADGLELMEELSFALTGVRTNAYAAFNRGGNYLNNGDYDRAINELTDAIRIDPNYAEAYSRRGYVYDYEEDYDRAIADYTQAIRLHPDDGGNYISRGDAYQYGKQDYNSAIADFTQAIRIDPDNGHTYSLRGNAYKRKGDYDRAIADFTQAIIRKADTVNAYFSRGMTYYDKQDYDSAIADFTQAIRLRPDYDNVYIWRGSAYKAKGQTGLSEADFETAQKIKTHAPALGRGWNEIVGGDPDVAIYEFSEVIKIDPNYAAAYSGRGRAYQVKNDYDHAIADLTQAIRIDPNYHATYLWRGESYHARGDYDRAIADFTQALRIDPNHAATYHNRGNAYNAKGQTALAEADYAKARQLEGGQ